MAEHKVTFCRICEASCGLVAEVDDGKVLRLLPDKQHVVSRGYACVKGTRYLDVHDSPDRVTRPLKRVGDGFEEVSWEQALDEIGERVTVLRAAHGDDSVGMYIGNPAALSPMNVLFANLFGQGLGTPHLYTSASQDCNNKFRAAQEMFGSPMLQPIPDLDRTSCAVLIGTNPAVSQLSFANAPRPMERLAGVEERGGRVVFVNPRRTESARQLGEQWFIRPGTDLFLLLSFLHTLFEEQGPAEHVLPHLEGVDTLRELVAPWTPERSAELTGVDAQQLRGLVARFCGLEPALMYASTGINQGPHGTLCMALIHAINLLSGNMDRPGGMLITEPTVRAARLAFPRGEAIDLSTSRVGGFQNILGTMPAGVLPDEILTPGKGQLRALFVTAGNPVLTCPNAERIDGALRRLELLVTIDLFRNETGQLADYVLPATSFLERDDMPMGMGGYQVEPYAQFSPAVAEPRGEARDEWWIFSHLARVCDAPLKGLRILQWCMNLHIALGGSWLPKRLRFTPRWAFAVQAWLLGTTLRSLVGSLRSGKRLPANRGGLLLGKNVFTPSGKVALWPEAFRREAGDLEARFAELLTERGALTLITKRERTSHNSWMHNVQSFVSGKRGTNYVYMHPDDAAARGLTAGAHCAVRTRVGAVELPLKLTDELMPGTVAVPHGWGHASAEGLRVARQTTGQNVNLLSPDGPESLEGLAGMAHLTALPVEVELLQRG